MLKTVAELGDLPVCLVYPADSFIAKDLCQQLLRQKCQVVAVSSQFAQDLLPLLDRPNFVFHYQEDWQKEPLAKIDYVFEISHQGELLPLAKKHKAKYEAVLTKEQPDLLTQAKRMRVDYRQVVGHQLFGPTLELLGDDFVNHSLKAGVTGSALQIPGNGLTRVYPLAIKDFVAGAARAMFRPGTKDQTFHFYGEPVSTFSLIHLIKEAADSKIEVKFVGEKEAGWIEKPPSGWSKQLGENLDWRPKQDLAKAIKRTVWQKQEEVADVKGRGKVKVVEETKDIEETKEIQVEKEREKKRVEREIEEDPRAEVEEAGEGVLPPIDWAQKEAKLKSIVQPADQPPSQLPSQPPKPKKRKVKRSWQAITYFLLSLFVFVLVCLLPFVGIGFQAYQGAMELKRAQQAIQAGQLKEFGSYCERARVKFALAKNWLSKTDPFLTLIKLDNVSLVFDFWLSLGQELAQTGVLAQHAGQTAAIFGKELLASSLVDVKSFTSQEEGLLDELILSMGMIENKIDNDDYLEIELPFWSSQKLTSQLKKNLPEVKKLAVSAKDALPLLPSLLATEGRKTYLILFQNNMELRPTGGFIGSFGLVTFEKGRFLDFGVMDVYAADGQLKGHVEPPAKLKEYLGEGGWYLRDANWDPDFPTSARQAAWFLEKEMGRTVDGVVAINLNLAKKLLETTDGVFLADYQEKITAVNLFERAEYHAEVGFFPGSTQKSDFLGSLANALLEEIKVGGEEDFLGLAWALYRSFSQQDILVYLAETKAMGQIRQLGWSGELTYLNCPSSQQNCYVDYQMIVEANLGVNKANYFVTRQIEQKIELDQDQVTHVLKIAYQNTAQSETWPAGKYKNYLRVYVPAGSVLGQCQMSGVKCQVDEFAEHGKKIFGVLVEVPIGEERSIEIDYQLPEKFPNQERVSYLFLQQKQSGMISTTNSLLFSFPTETKPLLISPAGAYSPGTLLFTNHLDKSRIYRVEFVR